MCLCDRNPVHCKTVTEIANLTTCPWLPGRPPGIWLAFPSDNQRSGTMLLILAHGDHPCDISRQQVRGLLRNKKVYAVALSSFIVSREMALTSQRIHCLLTHAGAISGRGASVGSTYEGECWRQWSAAAHEYAAEWVSVISSQGNTRARGQNVKMATTLQCRVQYLDDTDPFNSTNFPEPTRPPTYTFLTNVPLINQIAGVKRLLKAPHKVSARVSLQRLRHDSRCCFDCEHATLRGVLCWQTHRRGTCL